MSEPPAAPAPDIRVSNLELFFDLVFVFTITQMAVTLADHLNFATFGDVVLILAMVWWMYSGYAWLTNAVAPNSTMRRTLLLGGMAGFLVMSLAIPHAFGEYGWLFGASYLVVNGIHSALFQLAESRTRLAMRIITPLNMVAALLVLAGGFVPEPWRHLFWIAAPVLQIIGGYLHRAELHSIAAAHFAERHGLVIIVALGESVVSIGAGFAGVHLGLGAILVAVLGLCIAYYLWWFYFAGDDERAEHVLARTDSRRRARLALQAWGYAHYPMLLGILVLSVGIKKTVGHAFEGLPWSYAFTLAGGVALYLLGHAAFLAQLGLRGVPHRVIGAVVVLATIPLGRVSALAQLVAIPLIMSVTAIIEDVPELRRTGSTEISSFGRTARPE